MTSTAAEAIKTGLPPVAHADTQLFILGSLPGDASLHAERYYAHPGNQFWRLLGGAIGEALQPLDYATRLDVLARRRIGLWDVIGSARRRGSLDQAIRDADHNPLGVLLTDFPELRAIAFNGATAAAAGRRLLAGHAQSLTLIDLPSSSAAHAIVFAAKAERWVALGQFSGR